MLTVIALKRLALVGAMLLPPSGYAAADTIQSDAAKKFIESLGNRMVDMMKLPIGAAERSSKFTGLMLDSLDFDAIGTTALGKLARGTTPEQRREFTPLFAAYVIDFAIEKFGALQIKSFGLGSATSQSNGDAKVYTRITTNDRPLEIYWRVHESGGVTKINDIEIEGASLAIHYHGDFERAGVGSVPQIIARLKELTNTSRTLSQVQQATQ